MDLLARPALVSYAIKQIDLANQSRLYAGKSSLLNSLLDFQGLARAVSGPHSSGVRLLIGVYVEQWRISMYLCRHRISLPWQ